MPRLGRLGRRLALASVAAALAAVLVVAAIEIVALRLEFERFSREQQDQRAALIVASLADAYRLRGAWSAADAMGAEHLAASAGATLALYDEKGDPVGVGMGGATMPGMPGMGGMTMPGTLLGPERREPVVAGGRTVGTAVLRFPAEELLPAERDVRDALVRALVAGSAAATLVALGFAFVVAGRITHPLSDLAVAIDALRRGGHAARVAAAGDDEVGDLGRGFNAMADSLEREDQLRRHLLGDVAHELRTPLTTIQGHLEALRDGVLPAAPETFASLHDEAARLGRLVADLESLARAEAAGLSLERGPCDLASVARDVSAELADAFRAKDVALELALEPVGVLGDPDRLAQVARNLLSNALKYTPVGGVVRVRTARADGRATLEVADAGPGIAPADLEHVFERFWRGAGARETVGSGIGLTVARALARAHGGDVTVRSEVGRGSAFTLSLPSPTGAA